MAGQKIGFRDQVVQEIIERIEAGTAPWQKPWDAGTLGVGPFNPTSGKPYHGINDLWLSMRGYGDPRWMTYRQASAVDAQVRKGEHATSIEYWQWTVREAVKDGEGRPVLDDEGKERYETFRLDRPRVFYAKVFNAEQIDGLEPFIAPSPSFEPVAEAERIIAGAGVPVFHDQGDRAFYSPMKDEIHLPRRAAFADEVGYYETALHELGHATGHETRLNRFFGPRGSEGYAREELRAEIASYMLARDLGISFDPSNHAAYVESWLRSLREDKNEIFRAARDAEIIKTWVMEPGQRQALEESTRQKAEGQERAASPAVEIPSAALSADSFIRRIDAALNRLPDPLEGALDLHQTFREYMGQRPAEDLMDLDLSPERQAGMFHEAGLSAEELDTLLTRSSVASNWPARAAEPEPSAGVSPQEEFADFLKSNGLVIKGAPVMNGQWQRVPVEGDRKGQVSGSYRGFLDGRPSGQVTNFKAGIKAAKWAATGVTLSDAERARIKAEAAEVQARRDAEREAKAQEAAKVCFGVWRNLAGEATQENCPYLKEKGVQGHGVKVDAEGHLVVPARDAQGRLWSVQVFRDDGKRFVKNSRKEGMMHVISSGGDGKLSALAASRDAIVICEGYATGAEIHEDTGRPVVVAFDSGNLQAVAETVHATYPQRQILIAGDNDHANTLGNVGERKAGEAAEAVSGVAVVPAFNAGEKAQGLTDFNDLGQARGKQAVRRSIETALSQSRRQEIDFERSVA